MRWEWYAQELMYYQDDAESASGRQCAGPEWQESAPVDKKFLCIIYT